MQKQIILFLLFVVSLWAKSGTPVQAQMGTPRFVFSNRAQVKAAVLANLKQPRTTYDILICAGRQGMIGTALQTYEEVMAGNPFNATPEVKSAYALSHHLTLYPKRWYWKREMTPGLVAREWGNEGKVTLYRSDALEARPRSPEIMLANAIWLMTQGDSDGFKALGLVEQALRIAPQWADLHFWHAEILMSCAMNTRGSQMRVVYARNARLALKALDKARQFDPKFRQEDLSTRQGLYENLGRPREALAAFDAYVRYRPNWVKWRSQKQTRARLLAAVAKL